MRRAVPDSELIRYIDTITYDLVAECGACNHEVVLDVAEIITTRGANLWIGELRTSLNCQRCGARRASVFTGTRTVMSF